MKPTYIIAGNNREYEQWCRENRVDPSSPLVKYVPEFDGPRILNGGPMLEIICCGTYFRRKDIKEIRDIVREKTRPAIKIVYREAPKQEPKFFNTECLRKVSWRVPA